MKIEVHLTAQSRPITHSDVTNAYTKDGFYCVFIHDKNRVFKYPQVNIFRVIEEYSEVTSTKGGMVVG